MQRHAPGPIAASVFASLRISHVSCFTSRAWHRAIAVLFAIPFSFYFSVFFLNTIHSTGAWAWRPWGGPAGPAAMAGAWRGRLSARQPGPSASAVAFGDHGYGLPRPTARPSAAPVDREPNISSAATRPRRASARRARPTRHRNRNRNAPTSTAAHAHAKSSSPTRSFSTLAPTPDHVGRRRDNTRDMPPRLCRRLQLQLVRITHSTRCT